MTSYSDIDLGPHWLRPVMAWYGTSEPMLTTCIHKRGLMAFTLFHRKCSRYRSLIWVWKLLTLNVRGPSYLGLARSISWCWCPGFLRRQDISSHDIEYYWPYRVCRSYLIWGIILSTCVISMWRNDIKCKYMFMFTLKNLACKGLIQEYSSISQG